MRKYFLIATLIFCSSCWVFAQDKQVCPNISVIGPVGVVARGESATFVVDVSTTDPNKNKNLTYNWTVSQGTIVSGQGTHSIVVNSFEEVIDNKLTATAKIGGLEQGCRDEATNTAELGAKPECGLAFDEWGDIPMSYERFHLDNAAFFLSKNPTVFMSIIVFLEPKESKTSVLSQVSRIRKYLVNKWKTNLTRFRFYFAETEQRSTSIYMTTQEMSDVPRQAFDAKNSIEELRPTRKIKQ